MSKEISKPKKTFPKQPVISYSTDTSGIKWGPFYAVIVTILSYLLSGLIGQFFVWLYGSIFHHWNFSQSNDWLNNSDAGQFIYTLIVYASWAILLYYFLKHYRSSFKKIGWVKPKWFDLVYMLCGFLAYIFFYFVILLIIGKLFPSLNLNQQQDVGFQNSPHGFSLIYVFASLVLIPPIVEETVFRGFLFTSLRKTLPLVWAGLFTSLLFAAPHLFEGVGGALLWVGGIDTFILSLVLVYLREKTGGLWASMGLHFLKNGIAFVSLFYFAHAIL